jgi:hypothetical protein
VSLAPRGYGRLKFQHNNWLLNVKNVNVKDGVYYDMLVMKLKEV